MSRDIIIGPKTRAMRCDFCNHYWSRLYVYDNKCPKCNSTNVTLRAVFGHGTYQQVDKKVKDL